MIQVLLMALIGGMVMGLVMLVRNEIVYRIRIRILKECHDAAMIAITDGGGWKEANAPYDRLPSYQQMLWQLHKWTRKQWQ